jgi:hypothetical protein
MNDTEGANPWQLLKRSQLCLYDSRYFFLAFSKAGSTLVQYRWNLPDEMNHKFETLRNTAEFPDERHGIKLIPTCDINQKLKDRYSHPIGRTAHPTTAPTDNQYATAALSGLCFSIST